MIERLFPRPEMLNGFVRVASVVALLACAASPRPSTSTTGPGSNPCFVAGTCTVEILLPDDVSSQLARAGANFKVYSGCPRSLGFRENSSTNSTVAGGIGTGSDVTPRGDPSMRGAIPIVQSPNTEVVVPKMSGRYATVAIFFGSDPGKYTVVDFGRGPTQSVKFGYLYTTRGIVDDRIVDAQNRSNDRRYCQ